MLQVSHGTDLLWIVNQAVRIHAQANAKVVVREMWKCHRPMKPMKKEYKEKGYSKPVLRPVIAGVVHMNARVLAGKVVYHVRGVQVPVQVNVQVVLHVWAPVEPCVVLRNVINYKWDIVYIPLVFFLNDSVN